jgi:hypothetical protein
MDSCTVIYGVSQIMTDAILLADSNWQTVFCVTIRDCRVVIGKRSSLTLSWSRCDGLISLIMFHRKTGSWSRSTLFRPPFCFFIIRCEEARGVRKLEPPCLTCNLVRLSSIALHLVLICRRGMMWCYFICFLKLSWHQLTCYLFQCFYVQFVLCGRVTKCYVKEKNVKEKNVQKSLDISCACVINKASIFSNGNARWIEAYNQLRENVAHLLEQILILQMPYKVQSTKFYIYSSLGANVLQKCWTCDP